MSLQARTLPELLDEAAFGRARAKSLPCPKCGRYARVVVRDYDMSGEWWFQVDCKRCGVGVID